MDGHTYIQIPPEFYRTSSPFGDEAQKDAEAVTFGVYTGFFTLQDVDWAESSQILHRDFS